MTYRDALWSAIIGEAGKLSRLDKNTTKAKRDRYLKLTRYWQRAIK